jgi:hypothetical protein
VNYSLSDSPIAEKPRIFVSYHHRGDQQYYDAFSATFHDTFEAIYDKSVERIIDSDNVDYVMREIRENYITGTSCTVVLVGAQTWGRKYVDWEIKATLDKQHGLIGVHLPSAPRAPDGTKIIVPDRLHDNIQSGFAPFVSWAQITKSVQDLRTHIAAAVIREKRLINNVRDLRVRNA